MYSIDMILHKCANLVLQFAKNKEYVLFNCIFSSKNSDDYFHQNIYNAFYMAKIM